MKRNIFVTALFMSAFLLAVAGGIVAQAAGPIIYVTENGVGDCSSWSNSCSLQDALAAARTDSDIEQIWVQFGIYYPITCSGTCTEEDRTTSFELVDGVAIYGGFPGNPGQEGDFSTRDWGAYSTTLSGDIGDSSDADNSCHVVNGSGVSQDAALDGFKIVFGYNDRIGSPAECDEYNGGGGIYIENGSPTLRNLYLDTNHTNGNGGGLYAWASNALLENITFDNNQAFQNGGGLASISGSDLELFNVTLKFNSALGDGGGIFNENSGLTINTGRFEENHCDYFGGGLYNDSGPNDVDVLLTDVNFIDNTAIGNGGGMYHDGDSTIGITNLTEITFDGNESNKGAGLYIAWDDPNLSQVTFSNNVASLAGGGLFNDNGAPSLDRMIFLSNVAAEDGGGIYNYSPFPGMEVANAVFNNNQAVDGAGLYNVLGVLSLTNSTFWMNKAFSEGGGIYNDAADLGLTNSILWHNEANNLYNQIYNDIVYPVISYSLVQDSGGSGSGWDNNLGTDGGGNIDIDPLFLDADGVDDIPGSADDNLRLDFTSPAVDTGDNAVITTAYDLDGNPRIGNGLVDMGAYEAQIDNTAWQRALPLSLTGGPNDWEWTSLDQTINVRGESRWYKFNIHPGSRVAIKLSDMPVNYDLTLYTDIQIAYDALLAPENLDELIRQTAEFAPDSYAPDSYAPDSYAPDSYAPDAYSPDSYAPDSYAPDIWAPDSYAPDSYAPDSYAPDSYAPDSYAPDSYAPDSYAPDSYAPDSYAPDQAYTSAQMISLIAVSAFDGKAGELIAVNTWDNTGEFYIRVKGRNGAYSATDPFTLSVGQLSGACRDLDMGPDTTPTVAPGTFKTIILTDFGRMGLDPALGDGALLWTRLQDLANRPEVGGIVVDVGADPDVDFANNEADDPLNVQCPFAKNVVAHEIKDIINAYWNQNPLEYLVLIGNDDVLPYFRYPDRALLASEKDFEPPVQDDTTSFASLTLGYVLSQDFYGSKIQLSKNNTTLPIPHLAVGRLVEDPADIITYLDAYLADADGAISPTSALVSGYDFLEDAAEAIAIELEAGLDDDPNTTVVESLISPQDFSPKDPDPAVWTATDLGTALLESPHDLVFLAGHFSANSAMAADYDTHLLTTDLLAAPPGHFENTVIFSAGCHAGYNIVNPHGIYGLTLEPDWAQAFIQQGANLIAGTGYQYGDTDFIEYSERLYLFFSSQLRAGTGPVPIGKALIDAKNRYLANTPELRGIHEKALLEATLYGLPMFSVNMPYGRGPITQPPPNIVGTPTTFITKPGAVLGLAYSDVSVSPTLIPIDLDLHAIYKDVNKITATYFEGDDGVVTRPGEPVLPLSIYDVSVPNTALRGIGFRGGNYTDYPNIIPLTGAPTTEVRGVHPPFWTDVFFPIRTWQANYFDALSKDTGGLTTLTVTPLQFLSDAPDVYTGILRKFDNIAFRLYYNAHLQTYDKDGSTISPVLSAAPTIAKVTALASSGVVDFDVYVTGDPNVGIQEAWVTYTCEGTGTDPCYSSWQPLDLIQNAVDTRLWEASLTLNAVPGEDIRYMVQAVNGTGLVSLSTNLGYYFIPNIDPAEPPTSGQETTLAFQLGWDSDYYGSYVPMKAALTSNNNGIPDKIIYFALGSQKRAAKTDANGIAQVLFPLLSPPGDYRVRAAFIGDTDYQGSSAYAAVTIEKQPTALTISPETVITDLGSTAPFSITLKDSLDRPMRDKTVYTIVHGDNGIIAYKNTTNYLGQVMVNVEGLPLGEYSVDAYFSGQVPIPGLSRPLNLVDPIYEASLISGSLHLTGIDVPLVVEPIPVETTVQAIANFADPNFQADSIVWDWGDGSIVVEDDVETNQSGVVTANYHHTYSTAGVFILAATLYDGASPPNIISSEEYHYIVVYDPSEGFVTGGGWIYSPTGACQFDACTEETTGKATFGFFSKYKKGANVPTGTTTFHFKAGNLNFYSNTYQWLVVAGAKAMFKGTGTINGNGSYGFLISAIDADLTPSTEVDLFRIKIWEIDADMVVYDNQMGTDENADPTTAIGGGSITVHKK